MHFLDSPISFPGRLDQAICQAFLGSRPEAAAVNQGTVLAALWPRLAKYRGQEAKNHYAFGAAEANAYAAYYLPANCLKLPVILAEAESFGIDLWGAKENRWIDVGSGPGTALAGLALFAEQAKLPMQVTSIDQAKNFLGLADRLAREFSQMPGFTHQTLLAPKSSRELSEKILDKNPRYLSFLNSIAEIFPDPNARAIWLQSLTAELLRASKRDGEPRWVIIVEPGSLVASRELLELREKIRGFPGANILLPCFDARPCGALASPKDWCHEEVAINFPSWHSDLGARAGMRKEALLFSYLVLRVGGPEGAPPALSGASRMVSQRLERKGLAECWFCTPEGKKKARMSHAVQKRRAQPLPLPLRGAAYSRLVLSEKGEIDVAIPVVSEKVNRWEE